jgi:MGT family glycosyltransferase
MAKALFLSLPLAGHVNPTLLLVRELAARREEVIYYATGAFASAVEQAGARYRPYRSAFLADMSSLPERLHELSWLLMRTTAEVLDEQLDEFRSHGAAYIVTDSVAPWGNWLAEILGLPSVTSVSTFAINRRVLAFAAAQGIRPKSAGVFFSKLRHIAQALRLGRRLRRRYGVAGPGITGLVFGRSDLNIVYTSRYFQPCGESFDQRFEFVGPSFQHRQETADFPWERVRRPVIVYVSLGTLFHADTAFYRNCFEAFEGEEFQVILSAGANVSVESLGPAPANFIVRTRLPQLEVLRRAAVFVTHGGMNSVSESLYHGVPVVVVPQMSEQAMVGRCVEELGAGIYLAKEELTAGRLRESVRRLLDDSQFRKQAALVRESFETAGGIRRAADAILRFTGRATLASGSANN